MTDKTSQIRAAVDDLATHAARGDEPLAREARALLNDLCCELRGGVMTYPAWVCSELESHGLRTTA